MVDVNHLYPMITLLSGVILRECRRNLRLGPTDCKFDEECSQNSAPSLLLSQIVHRLANMHYVTVQLYIVNRKNDAG